MKKLYIAIPVLAGLLLLADGAVQHIRNQKKPTTNQPGCGPITMTVDAPAGVIVHVWDGTDHAFQSGQTVTVNSCSWKVPANNDGAVGFGVAVYVQNSTDRTWWGCEDMVHTVASLSFKVNGRSVKPIPYHDPTACSGAMRLVNGFISAKDMGIRVAMH